MYTRTKTGSVSKIRIKIKHITQHISEQRILIRIYPDLKTLVQVDLPKRNEVAVIQIFDVDDSPRVAPPPNLLTLRDFNDCTGTVHLLENEY